jgi:hypothetical protein
MTSSGHVTKRSVAPFTKVHRFLSSCTDKLTLETIFSQKNQEKRTHIRTHINEHTVEIIITHTYHRVGHEFCPYISRNKKPVDGNNTRKEN